MHINFKEFWRTKLLFKLTLCMFGLPLHSFAQQALPGLVHSNEVFARKLLVATQAADPSASVVLAPLPLTIQFAAIHSHSWIEEKETQTELAATFDWDKILNLEGASRMLLGAFSKGPWSAGGVSHAASTDITTTVYTSPLLPDQIFQPDFLQSAQQYFGMTFKRADRPFASLSKGKITGVIIDARMNLQMPWRADLFSLWPPVADDFHNLSGPATRVSMLRSDMRKYPHVKNDKYEAVELPCAGGSMIVILPARGRTIAEAETQLVTAVDELDHSLEPQFGQIFLPKFHIHVEHSLRAPLEEIGIHRLFNSLGPIVKLKQGAYIDQISQEIDLTIDQEGIWANAKTVTFVGVAGMGTVPKPFVMVVDRPFLFLIRDRTTGATTLLGAVVELPKSDPQSKLSTP